MIIYQNTEKELFYNNDYQPLPDLSMLSIDSLKELKSNVEQAAGNAFLNGSSLLEMALYNDLTEIENELKNRMINYPATLKKIDSIIKTYSNGLYSITDTIKAISETIQAYYNSCDKININVKIDREKRLYKHGMKALLKAINKR